MNPPRATNDELFPQRCIRFPLKIIATGLSVFSFKLFLFVFIFRDIYISFEFLSDQRKITLINRCVFTRINQSDVYRYQGAIDVNNIPRKALTETHTA